MPGNIVQATNLDSVRIEVLGGNCAVTIPATLILAANRVMRQCLVDEARLTVLLIGGRWQACNGIFAASGSTAWEALKNLADELERK